MLCRGEREALIVKNDSHYFPLTIKLRGNPSFSEVRTNKNDQTHTCTASMQREYDKHARECDIPHEQ